MNAGQFSDKLGGRKTGSGYQAKCPAHADNTASLSITDGDDGKLMLYCHAGCAFADILSAGGVSMDEAFPVKLESTATKARPKIVAEYDYRDESGELLYQAIRMEPKTFRQRHPHKNAWKWSLPASIRRVLYGTQKLSKAPQGSIVFVVEGEKDANLLQGAGLYATTNIGGAGKWHENYTKQLVGMRVVIVPDNDEPGNAHALKVSASLTASNVENSILRLPNLPEKGDVSDWRRAGGTSAKLLELAEKALSLPPVEVPAENGFVRSSDRLESAVARRRKLAKKIIPFNISFLDDICRGIHPTDLIILSADTGAGKTTMGSLIARKAAAKGKRVSFFALEAFQDEIEQRIIYGEMIKLMRSEQIETEKFSFTSYMYGEMSDFDKFEDKAADNIASTLTTLRTFYRKEQFGAADITRTFKEVIGDSDLIVLDHLHYVDTDGAGENADLKAIIKAIRNATLEAEVPVIVIAHLRKKDGKRKALIPDVSDIHGSSDVSKVATKVIMLSSLQTLLPNRQPGVSHTLIHVPKDRYATASSYAGLMRYDLTGTDYAEGYALVRLGAGATSLEQLRPGQLPHWASRGKGCAGQIQNIENGKAVD